MADKRDKPDIHDIHGKISKDIRSMQGKIQDNIHDVQGRVQDNIQDVNEKIQDVGGKIQDDIQDVQGRIRDNIHDVGGKIQDDFHDVQGRVQDNIHDIQGKIQDNIQEVHENIKDIGEDIQEFHENMQNKGLLVKIKLREYIPVMLVTNLSAIMLSLSDSVITGNLLGTNAVAAISILSSFMQVVFAFTTLITTGVASRFSEVLGLQDRARFTTVKRAAVYITLIVALAFAITQIPVAMVMINSYGLTGQVRDMTVQYAIGLMFSLPIGIVNAACNFELQSIGKMGVVMKLTVIEGVVNILLDILFVGPMAMGIAGAAYGTAGATILRCILSISYMLLKTKLLKLGRGPCLHEMRLILKSGLLEFVNFISRAVLTYFLINCFLGALGHQGLTVKGICDSAQSLVMLIITSVVGASRPLLGLMQGAGDHEGERNLMQRATLAGFLMVGLAVIFIEIFPQTIFYLYGVYNKTELGYAALRVFAPTFLFMLGTNLLRMYFSCEGDTRIISLVTLIGGTALPLCFALILERTLAGPWMWLCFLGSEIIMTVYYIIRYWRTMKGKYEEIMPGEYNLHLDVSSEEIPYLEERVADDLREKGLSGKIDTILPLCIEEMTAYTVPRDGQELFINIFIRCLDDEVKVSIMDNGLCNGLNEKAPEDPDGPATEANELIRRLAKTIKYQYVLNLNYTTIVLDLSSHPKFSQEA